MIVFWGCILGKAFRGRLMRKIEASEFLGRAFFTFGCTFSSALGSVFWQGIFFLLAIFTSLSLSCPSGCPWKQPQPPTTLSPYSPSPDEDQWQWRMPYYICRTSGPSRVRSQPSNYLLIVVNTPPVSLLGASLGPKAAELWPSFSERLNPL